MAGILLYLSCFWYVSHASHHQPVLFYSAPRILQVPGTAIMLLPAMHQVEDPRWGYGSVTLDTSGNYTALWTSLNHTNEMSAGTIQINTTGLITVDNQSLTHGVMNDDKDLIVFIDGTNQSQGNALTVMVKRSPAVQSGQNLLLLSRPTK